MLMSLVYPIIKMIVVSVVMAIVVLMLLRLLITYLDPNPFGAVGRFAYKVKRFTDKLVQPSTDFLFKLNITTKIAPLITILVFCIFGYFTLQLFGNVLFTIDGVTISAASGNVIKIIGFLLYGLLGLYSLLIVMRIIFSWFMSFMNPVMRFLMRITDPILVPFRRLMPPIMMFDISPIIVLFILGFLQTAVAAVFLA
ncbi:MAG TPA: YggT family protein [Pyrinomonadaceae bacterium]|nr:YggT family protein [Pyrinomonadaceae bacterium]